MQPDTSACARTRTQYTIHCFDILRSFLGLQQKVDGTCAEKGKGGKRIVLFSRCIRGSRTKHACNPKHTNAAIVCRSHISPHRYSCLSSSVGPINQDNNPFGWRGGIRAGLVFPQRVRCWLLQLLRIICRRRAAFYPLSSIYILIYQIIIIFSNSCKI